MNLLITFLNLGIVAISATSKENPEEPESLPIAVPVESNSSDEESISTEVEAENVQPVAPVDPYKYNMEIFQRILGNLYGDAVDNFNGDPAQNKHHETMNIDCTSKLEDGDFSTNVVTTLCPFLRGDSPCGAVRHPSYEVEDGKLFCSEECRPYVSSLVAALPHRGDIELESDAVIFREVANMLLRQYCSLCRAGCYVPER